MATALLTAAILTAVPTLPRSDGIDHSADESRTTLAHQIREHQDYVTHIRAVWRHRRAQEAAAAVPETTTPTTPTYTSGGSWADELAAVGFPSWAIPTMLYYIDRESGGDPSAVNGGGSAYTGGPACGLTQLYPCPGPQALDPMTNLTYAFEKFQASGFSPWGG